jgi:hypothetical protein
MYLGVPADAPWSMANHIADGHVASDGRSSAAGGIGFAGGSVPAEIGVLEQAIEDGRVTFHFVAHAWFRVCDSALSDEERGRFQDLFPKLVKAFAGPRGGVITSYFCRHIPVAAALTDIDTAARLGEGVPAQQQDATESAPNVERAEPPAPGFLADYRARRRERRSYLDRERRQRREATSSAIHLEPMSGQPGDWKAKELLFRCMDLHNRALQFLKPKPRKICMRMVFGIVVALLGALDHPTLAPGARSRPFSADLSAVEALEAQLEQARRYYDRSAQHQAQYEYFVGMVFGLAALLIAVFVIGLIAQSDLLKEPLLAAPLAGGAGALVSVMTRMTRGQLVVNYESGRRTIRLIGAMRPVIGALFGGALYLLLAGGLVTIAQTPTDATKLLYFYTAIAFLAGFSERWAQDVVAGAENAVSTATAPPAARPNPTPHVPGTK